MTSPGSSYAPYSSAPAVRTEVTCTKCHKATSVPFVPTPGRPIFCRECFAKTSNGPRPSGGGFGGGGGAPARKPNALPHKRMMAQGRKTHFIYDATAVIRGMEGGMEDKDTRAFLEGLFARGARGSTEDAQVFLEEKVKAGNVTHDQAVLLGKLIDKYSFAR